MIRKQRENSQADENDNKRKYNITRNNKLARTTW